jgi:hypothetical protein
MADDKDSMTARGNKGSVLSTTSSLGEEKKATAAASQANASASCSSFSLTTPKGTKVDVKTLRDVVNEVPVEREWTVEGIAPDSGLGIVGGRHKRGKSTLGMHLSRSVEAGEPFLDRETRKAPVVYVNYEMPLDYFVSLSSTDPIPETFFVVNRPEARLKAETISAVINAMNERGFVKGLMVIDSFRGAFKLQADQENQSGAAGLILRVVQEIAVQTGWLIFVIHHHKKNASGEGSDNLSGTGDFGAAADVLWTWSRPADASKPGLLEVEGRFPPVDPMVILLNPDDCILLGTRKESAEEDEKSKICAALGSERLSGKAISIKTTIPYSTVMKRLNVLKAEDKVDCEKGEGKGSVLLWFQIDAYCLNDPQVDEAS